MSEDRTTGAPPETTGGTTPPGERTQAVSPPGTAPDADRSADRGADRSADRTAPDVPAPAEARTSRTAPQGTAAPATGAHGAPTTVLPSSGGRPSRPSPPRVERTPAEPRASRAQARPAGRRRARLVLQRIDAWSVFLFSLVASICLGVVLFVAVAALYAALSSLGVLGSLNSVLGEVAGTGAGGEVVEPFITSSRVLGATAVLAAIDVVLLTALATLGALLYNLCASLTGGIEVQLGERD